MSNPTFSMIIPSHNYANYLGLTIDSVYQQERDDVEVIVVDDASTDATPEVVARYPQVRSIRLEENVGPARAWSIGLAQAKGRFVAKLDADDWQLPGWFDKVERAFASDPEIGLVAGSAVLFRDGNLLVERVTRQDRVLSAPELRRRMLRQFFFRMPAVCLRAEVIQGQEPPRTNLRLPHDWEYFIRATRGWNAVLLRDLLAVYRIHATSLTVTSKDENRLLQDYDRLYRMFSDPADPAYLDGTERRSAITAMARGYLGSVGPRLSLRDPAAVYEHLCVALDIAGWAGLRSVAATIVYLGRGLWKRVTPVPRYRRDGGLTVEDLLPRGHIECDNDQTATG